MSLALQAVVSLNHSAFTSGMASLSQAVSNVTGAMSMAFGGVASEILAMSKAFGPVGGAVAALKEAVTVGASFEQQIANVSSVSGLMGEELKKVEVSARDLAKTTRFTATEAGDALYSLASAGVTGADALSNTLKPALLLAGATLSSTQMATEAVTAALANFQIPAAEAGRIADQFAGAIAVSPATMERLSAAMKYAGPAAAGFGIALEKTVAEVAAFHQVGLRGEMAGTSFRMALVQLSQAAAKTGKETTEISKALDGWSASTEGVTGAVRRLNNAGIDTADVIQELGARAGPGMAALMKIGSDAMEKLAERINENADVARIYEIQMNTLTGKFYIFKSAVEDVFQEIFVNLSPALQKLTDGATEVVEAFSKMLKAMISGDWTTVKKMFASLWADIISGVKGAFETVREYAGKMADAFKNINWGDSFSTLKNTATNTWSAIVAQSSAALSKITDYLKGMDWGAVWETVKQGAITAFNFWYGHVAEVWGNIASFLKSVNGAELWDAIKAGGIMAWGEIKSIATEIWPTIQGYAKNAWAAVAESARIAMDVTGASISGVDYRGAFAAIPEYLSTALASAYKAALEWWNNMNGLIAGIQWGEMGKMVYDAVRDAADIVVDVFQSLASSGVIGDIFKRIGETIGTVLKAAFELIGGFFHGAWSDLESGGWQERAKRFFKSVFIGGLEAINALFKGALETLFGRNVIDNVVAGAMLMMLDIKMAIQSKIGEILTAFNELMAGIITKTAGGAARVAEIFGFEGMGEKIREKADEFADAFRSGTNGMTEAAQQTGKEIKALEQYVVDLNKPAQDAANSMAVLSEKTSEVADNTQKAVTAIGESSEETNTASGFWDAYQKSIFDANKAMAENLVNMRQFSPVAADMAQVMDVTGVAMSSAGVAAKSLAKEADGAKQSAKDMLGEVSKFKELKITGFDVSDFTFSLKQLKQSLVDIDLPSIKLPDFSSFKLPKITPEQVSKFTNSLRLLVMQMTGLDTITFKMPEIKMPDIDSGKVKSFLASLTELKDGLMKIDFGALGGINIDIKGGGASDAVERLDKILNFMESKNGILWA